MMPGFGFGFGQRMPARPSGGGDSGPVAPMGVVLEPGPGWTGIESSGYATLPVDPVRTTAKPAMRLLTPPNQFFADELVVGVMAGANAGGTLVNNLGLAKVIVHFEGASADITAPSFHTFTADDGSVRTYLGWWARLKKPVGVSGLARVYFEAVPLDPTLQHRVMGPYQFSPRDPFPSTGSVHDFQLEVAATPAEITGQRYKTIKAAQSWLRNQNAQNPLITITETGLYNLERYNTNFGAYSGAGYCTITASVPVTFGRSGEFLNNAAAQTRTFYDGTHFKGPNITFDMRLMDGIFSEGGETGRQHWFSGVTVMNSGGRGYLWRKMPRTFNFCRFRPWITECDISHLPNMVNGASLVRGCYLHGGYSDCATDADCVIDNRIHDWDSRPHIDEIPALTVNYTGAGASATLTLAGNSIATSRTLTARVGGATVGTFAITNTEAGWIANTNYTIANVVNWLNSLPGWTATLLDNERGAGAISKLDGKGGPFTNLDVKTAPATLVTMIDLHADFWQLLEDYSGQITNRANRIVMGNVLTEFAGQKIFLSAGTVQAHDMLFLNNAMHDMEDTGYQNNLVLLSQLARSAHSHVVIAHNSMMQAMVLRTELGYNPDQYCLVANNVLRGLVWGGTPDADLVIKNNHLFANATTPPFATGTTTGGDHISLWADAQNGNFTPTGALLANPKPAVLAFDAARTARTGSSFVGSLAV